MTEVSDAEEKKKTSCANINKIIKKTKPKNLFIFIGNAQVFISNMFK